MNIGTAIGIFLALAILLLVLFCIITKYFHHKLQQNIDQPQEVYSMVDQIHIAKDNTEDELEDNGQDEYQKYKADRMKQKFGEKWGRKDQMMFQMAQMSALQHMKVPLNTDDTVMHGLSAIKKRLLGGAVPPSQQSNRSTSSLKNFNIQKIISSRSNKNISPLQNPPTNIVHTFVSKLVSYQQRGLTIIQFKVNSLRRLIDNTIKQAKKHSIIFIEPLDPSFDDKLELIGMERGQYGYMQHNTTVEIESMFTDQQYPVNQQTTLEQKIPISIQEYLRIRGQNGIFGVYGNQNAK